LAAEVGAFVERAIPKAEEAWRKREIASDPFSEIVGLGFLSQCLINRRNNLKLTKLGFSEFSLRITVTCPPTSGREV